MADRYWVGGSANWDATAGTKWALTSGGAGGEAVPNAADDVYIDSGSGAVTVTASSSSICRNLSFTSGAGDFAGTFAGTSGMTVAGSLTFVAGMTRTYTGTFTFTSTTAQTITTNGLVLDNGLTFNGVGGSWQLQDNLTTGVTRTVLLTNGSIDLNDYVLTTGIFNSNNTNTRSVAFGTGKIVLTQNSSLILEISDQTNFTYTGTPIFEANYSGSTGTRTFRIARTAGGTEANAMDLRIVDGSDAITLTNNTIFRNLDFTGFSGTLNNQATVIYGDLTLGAGMTTASGANPTTFKSTSSGKNVTSNGVTLNYPVTFDGIGGEWALQDDFVIGGARNLTLTNGTFDANGHDVTSGRFLSGNTNTRTLKMGSGTFTVNDQTNNATVWQFGLVSTGLTIVPGTSKIVIDVGTSTLSFVNLGDSTFYDIEIVSGTLISFQGGGSSAGFNQASNSVTPLTIRFNEGDTIQFNNFAFNGTPGNQLTLESRVPGSQYTLSQPSGVVSMSNTTISDSVATGGALWQAYLINDNIDGGNNVGWDFYPQIGRYIYTRRKNKRILL